jgi:hypothetical protein
MGVIKEKLKGLLPDEILDRLDAIVADSDDLLALSGADFSNLTGLVAVESQLATLAGIQTALSALAANATTLNGGITYDQGIEVVTVGAISVAKKTSNISIDGTKAYTLANGTTVGQLKVLVCTVAANTPAGTVTPATMLGGTALAFNAVGDTATLEWNGGAWCVLATNSVTVS